MKADPIISDVLWFDALGSKFYALHTRYPGQGPAPTNASPYTTLRRFDRPMLTVLTRELPVELLQPFPFDTTRFPVA